MIIEYLSIFAQNKGLSDDYGLKIGLWVYLSVHYFLWRPASLLVPGRPRARIRDKPIQVRTKRTIVGTIGMIGAVPTLVPRAHHYKAVHYQERPSHWTLDRTCDFCTSLTRVQNVIYLGQPNLPSQANTPLNIRLTLTNDNPSCVHKLCLTPQCGFMHFPIGRFLGTRKDLKQYLSFFLYQFFNHKIIGVCHSLLTSNN